MALGGGDGAGGGVVDRAAPASAAAGTSLFQERPLGDVSGDCMPCATSEDFNAV